MSLCEFAMQCNAIPLCTSAAITKMLEKCMEEANRWTMKLPTRQPCLPHVHFVPYATRSGWRAAKASVD